MPADSSVQKEVLSEAMLEALRIRASIPRDVVGIEETGKSCRRTQPGGKRHSPTNPKDSGYVSRGTKAVVCFPTVMDEPGPSTQPDEDPAVRGRDGIEPLQCHRQDTGIGWRF
jgi:hypothetical protein